MRLRNFARALEVVGVFVVLVVVGTSVGSSTVQAGNDDATGDQSRVERALALAPVPLNLEGKDRKLVALGSYIVNAVAGCNGCHSAGPQTEYTQSGNPYLLPPVFSGTKQVNPQTYLGGGRDFGPLVPGSAHIVSRNLTPDKTGRPEGGHTFEEFVQIMRTGVDLDHRHPTCTGAPDESCVPFPFNGDLLQIMPWPDFQDMSDRELRAIYEYLSAIPCIEGPADPQNPLHNDCG